MQRQWSGEDGFLLIVKLATVVLVDFLHAESYAVGHYFEDLHPHEQSLLDYLGDILSGLLPNLARVHDGWQSVLHIEDVHETTHATHLRHFPLEDLIHLQSLDLRSLLLLAFSLSPALLRSCSFL